jgi:multiple antibiotic resistance protein
MSLFTLFVLYFTSFFTIINPLGVMPVFMTMTADISDADRRKTARKAVIVSFFTLIAFAFSGRILFDFFGISVNSFRIAGGIIFFMIGYDMLQARLGKTKMSEGEVKKYVNDISVTPLAIPMITGPGAITNAIVLMKDSQTTEQKLLLFGVIFFVMLLTFLILWGGSKITNFLGETGNKVLMRLMGLIVMVIAVEFFFSGLKPVLQDIFHIIPK